MIELNISLSKVSNSESSGNFSLIIWSVNSLTKNFHFGRYRLSFLQLKFQFQNLLNVSNITVHDGYKMFSRFETEQRFLGWQIQREKIVVINDLAILTLSDSVSFNTKVKPACLPADASEDHSFKMATVAGWGQLLTNPDISLPETPRAATQMVLSNKMCELMYREASIQRYVNSNSSMRVK